MSLALILAKDNAGLSFPGMHDLLSPRIRNQSDSRPDNREGPYSEGSILRARDSESNSGRYGCVFFRERTESYTQYLVSRTRSEGTCPWGKYL
jgi:hypothetical protein